MWRGSRGVMLVTTITSATNTIQPTTTSTTKNTWYKSHIQKKNWFYLIENSAVRSVAKFFFPRKWNKRKTGKLTWKVILWIMNIEEKNNKKCILFYKFILFVLLLQCMPSAYAHPCTLHPRATCVLFFIIIIISSEFLEMSFVKWFSIFSIFFLLILPVHKLWNSRCNCNCKSKCIDRYCKWEMWVKYSYSISNATYT